MRPSVTKIKIALALALAATRPALAGELTNAVVPATARGFYNSGTRLLAAKKYADAEKMFQSSLAAQDGPMQPLALYNLGHARFGEGVEILKKGPDAQQATALGNPALVRGGNAIRSAESALAENNLEKMVAAYLEGRGARRNLRAAEKAVQAAMETYGQALQKWRRAADDFKGAMELKPADTNALRNAEAVELGIAQLVDSLQQMQAMAGAMGGQQAQLGKLTGKLKGQIPAPDAPPDGTGDDGEDDDGGVQPDSLKGREEKAAREGDQMQTQLSPDAASQILNGLSLDGSRRLPMGDTQGAPPKDKAGRNW